MARQERRAVPEPVATTIAPKGPTPPEKGMVITPSSGKEDTGRFFIVENLTQGQVSIPHPDRRRSGADDIVLQPKWHQGDRIPLGPDEARPWKASRDLKKMVDQGYVTTYEADEMPSEWEREPFEVQPSRPQDRELARQMVFAADDMAEAIINMRPVREREAGSPVDNEWLKTRLYPILVMAEWLESHRQNRRKRLKLIRDRMKAIQALP